MVPATTLTDLDHIHPEFAVFGGHIGKFWVRLTRPAHRQSASPYPQVTYVTFVLRQGTASLGGFAVAGR